MGNLIGRPGPVWVHVLPHFNILHNSMIEPHIPSTALGLLPPKNSYCDSVTIFILLLLKLIEFEFGLSDTKQGGRNQARTVILRTILLIWG